MDKQTSILISSKSSRYAKNAAANQLRAYAPSRVQEAKLFATLRTSQDPDKQEHARNRIYQSVYPTIYSLAYDFHINCKKLEESDFFNQGFLGALKALERFDPAKANGAKFSTFAFPYIKHAMVEACVEFMSPVHMTTAQFKRVKKIIDAKQAFKKEFGRDPSVDELKERLPEEYSIIYIDNNMNGIPQAISIDATVNPDDPNSNDMLFDSINLSNGCNSFCDAILKKENTDFLFEKFHLLDKEKQTVLTHYYGLNGNPRLTLSQIGILLNCSTQTVSRIVREGDIQLRGMMTMPDSVE